MTTFCRSLVDLISHKGKTTRLACLREMDLSSGNNKSQSREGFKLSNDVFQIKLRNNGTNDNNI
jgi:hypothetical protein